MIYFDHNATTPIDERVLEAMQPFLTTFYGNPSSLYKQGRVVRSAIDVAREQLAALVQVQPSQVIFTSGGTEANNMAIASARHNSKIAVSAIEHTSVMQPALALRDQGRQVEIIPVDENGVVTSQALEQAMAARIEFVSIMLVNNETGVVQNIAQHAEQLQGKNILLHTDAVQALGKIPLSFAQLGADYLTVSSHKIYGPKGCGALIMAKHAEAKALILGGGQEQGYRSGTENVAAIVGFGKAAELAALEFVERNAWTGKLTKMLEQGLAEIPEVKVFSDQVQRIANTSQFAIHGLDGEMLLMRLDQNNIAVSSGSACASGGLEPSPVLTAMGVELSEAKSAIRVSFGKTNSEMEVIEFIKLLKQLLRL